MPLSERVGVFDVVQRLRTALGHLDAVTRMVESDRSCADVLHQLSAVQGGSMLWAVSCWSVICATA